MMLATKLECFTHSFSKWAGSASGFMGALFSVIVLLLLGETCRFSHDWESMMTIYISTITFLMVFLIQRSHNKELMILHVKLNELLAATQHADNRLINVEHLTEKEISEVQDIHHRIGDVEG